jgi:hypothetical protein
MSTEGSEIAEVTLKHGELEVIVRGPSEVIDALDKVEVSAHPGEGMLPPDKLVTAIGGDFRLDSGTHLARWHEAVRPHHRDASEAPRPYFEITVFE